MRKCKTIQKGHSAKQPLGLHLCRSVRYASVNQMAMLPAGNSSEPKSQWFLLMSLAFSSKELSKSPIQVFGMTRRFSQPGAIDQSISSQHSNRPILWKNRGMRRNEERKRKTKNTNGFFCVFFTIIKLRDLMSNIRLVRLTFTLASSTSVFRSVIGGHGPCKPT